MWLTIKELFQVVKSSNNEFDFRIKASFLEIYNEVIRDLTNPNQENLEIRED